MWDHSVVFRHLLPNQSFRISLKGLSTTTPNIAKPIVGGPMGVNSNPGFWTIKIPASTISNAIIVVTVVMDSTIGQNATNSAAFNCTTGAIAPIPTGLAGSTAPICISPDIIDGRLNAVCKYSAQTAAVYCQPDGGLNITEVWPDSHGRRGWTISKKRIDSVPANPAKNTLIWQGP